MAKEKSPIAEWYNDRSIFVTGGSGFMGKVLVEKLLYSCSGLKNIYLLMRHKRGRTPNQRIDDMWKLPMFERLRKTQPNAVKKLVPVVGEMNAERLGLNEADEKSLTEDVSVIFHCAATLRMEEKLKTAISQNVGGTARMLELAKKMKNLKAFVYYSTAFCSADIDIFEEKIYDCEANPLQIIDVAKWIDDEALEQATSAIIKPHPNTYTYTKRVGENLVANEAKHLPVCIIRPSIVTPAWSEPLPGWVDSLNGPVGVMVGAAKGVIRSMYCKKENSAHCIPVDMAICASIVAAQRLGSAPEKPKEVPVYNLSQHEGVPTTWGDVLRISKELAYEYPFEQQIWHVDGDMRANLYVHYLCCFFFHWIPALCIDAILTIFRQKTFMIRLQKKIHRGLELLQFFTTREWVFRTTNFLNLSKTMTEADNKVFPMDLKVLTPEEYFRICILGARQYCMKEDPSSIPMCRIKQKVLYVIHKMTVYGFYIGIIYMLASYSENVRMVLSFFRNFVGTLPVFGQFVKSQ